MPRVTGKTRFILISLLFVVTSLAVACGGDDGEDDSPVATSAPAQPTAAAAATTTPADSMPPEAGSGMPSGSMSVAVSRLHAGTGTPQFCSAGCSENFYMASVQETLFRPVLGDMLGAEPEEGILATGWTLSPDLSYLEFDIRKGVEFHDGWGQMTAEDVVFSFNNANSNTTPESVHGQAGDFAPLIANFEVIDEFTARMNYANYDSRGIRHRFSSFWQTAGIVPKKAFDDLGADGMRDVLAGTGPYEVESWIDSDKAVLKAVVDHWRKTPSVETMAIIQVSESATRRAMLETGQVAIALPSLKDWKALESAGFVRSEGSGLTIQRSIAMTGNYWESNRYYDDKELIREAADKPWVSPAEDVDPARFESARLVRQALAHAIDREGLVASIMDGFGGPTYFAYAPLLSDPSFKQGTYIDPSRGGGGGWEIPFDVSLAKEFLAEAGYPDGFDMENLWVGPPGTSAELVTAVTGIWAAELGVNVTLNNSVYSTYRPGLVARSTSEPFAGCGDDNKSNFPFDWARGFVMSSWSDGGYGVGMEIPFAADNYGKAAVLADKTERLKLNSAFVQQGMDAALCIGLVLDPITPMYSPDVIASWDHLPTGNGNLNTINNLESIVLK